MTLSRSSRSLRIFLFDTSNSPTRDTLMNGPPSPLRSVLTGNERVTSRLDDNFQAWNRLPRNLSIQTLTPPAQIFLEIVDCCLTLEWDTTTNKGLSKIHCSANKQPTLLQIFAIFAFIRV